MRTLGSFNHSGPMKSRSRSCYDNSPLGLWRVAIRRPAAWLGWPPEPGHFSRNGRTLTLGDDTRAGEAQRLDKDWAAWPSSVLRHWPRLRRSAAQDEVLTGGIKENA